MPTYATNKRARFDYDILETLEAGLELTGQEVKSIRGGHMQLKGSHVTFHGDEAFLINAHVSAYKHAGPLPGYDPERSRRLLLRHKQIDYLRGKRQERGLTVVPLSVYTKGPNIKVAIGVAQGKKKFDKRAAIKKREHKREVRRIMKG
ncbi:MAG TPA: SsrA-binding protein [Candidatus Magasanikbacteria bacterium]|nr:SsrA-binding protein [Candidatus Magasanikbacteria bacterium]